MEPWVEEPTEIWAKNIKGYKSNDMQLKLSWRQCVCVSFEQISGSAGMITPIWT